MRGVPKRRDGIEQGGIIRRRWPWVILACVFLLAAAATSLSFIPPSFVKMTRAPDAGDEEDPATFPHAAHQRVFLCFNCHPSIFSYDKNVMTHDDFDRGAFCARCHDGRASWKIEDAECETCHVD